MAVIVGSARGDENNRAHGGKAGDQKSGKEVSTQNWYKHTKGWRVFRAIDPNKAAIIGQQMRAACENDMIGYDQYERYDLFAEAKKVGFDLAAVAVPTECDCSELVRCCCAAAGIMDLPTRDFRTINMAKHLLKTGEFVELEGSKYTEQSEYLGAGDILVTRTSGHTVVVLTNGKKYEGTIIPEEPELGERLLRNGDAGPDVKTMQAYLLELDYDLGKWGADGDYGDMTEMAVEEFQLWAGVDSDGIYGPITHEALMAEIEKQKAPEIPRKVRIEGGDCWARTAPNTDGTRLGVARDGDELPYGGETAANGWHLVAFENKNAWVSGVYGKLID